MLKNLENKNMALKKPENMQYEEAIGELEQIVNHLEAGELPLEDALKQFERGISLARSNSQKLQKAQQQVAILMQNDSHSPLQEFSES
ncbi:exodeoxyribonuclease 7 small subunit [Psychromonas marina]|uniref:Exodeoxyribonuclease 7 small subunit n=2 Tax=Psychromonas marina TaxID=88364 RepID=A0ABQ6E2D3_9GAMM|nr:exodeoxyribonuclease 7 small subunit [Psychromonas marina]